HGHHIVVRDERPGSKSLYLSRKALRSGTSGRPLTMEDQTEHETDPERGKNCLRRILADVLLAVVLKTAYAMECVIQYFFSPLPIFISHRACGRAEVFRRLARMRRAMICFFF